MAYWESCLFLQLETLALESQPLANILDHSVILVTLNATQNSL